MQTTKILLTYKQPLTRNGLQWAQTGHVKKNMSNMYLTMSQTSEEYTVLKICKLHKYNLDMFNMCSMHGHEISKQRQPQTSRIAPQICRVLQIKGVIVKLGIVVMSTRTDKNIQPPKTTQIQGGIKTSLSKEFWTEN
eukprot:TRINITY_DN45540_c0_g1_i1.p1 TRINITY_DN45540_c0_g1~~TRINITY_DN45540_c0_g1_i1.p1  ORF type:complete len:137 (+),score=2.44 TRINITY_DN45540_c0_g1_i1:165-575(+)